MTPVPLALPWIATEDMFSPYTTDHTLPVGTVTVTPLLIVTGPKVPAFLPEGTE
jgi:hypothetical protein